MIDVTEVCDTWLTYAIDMIGTWPISLARDWHRSKMWQMIDMSDTWSSDRHVWHMTDVARAWLTSPTWLTRDWNITETWTALWHVTCDWHDWHLINTWVTRDQCLTNAWHVTNTCDTWLTLDWHVINMIDTWPICLTHDAIYATGMCPTRDSHVISTCPTCDWHDRVFTDKWSSHNQHVTADQPLAGMWLTLDWHYWHVTNTFRTGDKRFTIGAWPTRDWHVIDVIVILGQHMTFHQCVTKAWLTHEHVTWHNSHDWHDQHICDTRHVIDRIESHMSNMWLTRYTYDWRVINTCDTWPTRDQSVIDTWLTWLTWHICDTIEVIGMWHLIVTWSARVAHDRHLIDTWLTRDIDSWSLREHVCDRHVMWPYVTHDWHGLHVTRLTRDWRIWRVTDSRMTWLARDKYITRDWHVIGNVYDMTVTWLECDTWPTRDQHDWHVIDMIDVMTRLWHVTDTIETWLAHVQHVADTRSTHDQHVIVTWLPVWHDQWDTEHDWHLTNTW